MGTDLSRRSSRNMDGYADVVHQSSTDHSPYNCPEVAEIPLVPWLDPATAAFVRDIAATVACRHPDLRAVILYGSVARQEQRSLDDETPSDVDLLLLFDLESDLKSMPFERRAAVFHSIELAHGRHLDAPRDVNAIPVVRDLSDWDEMFVENVARDGLLLWARGPLPDVLAPVAGRAFPTGDKV